MSEQPGVADDTSERELVDGARVAEGIVSAEGNPLTQPSSADADAADLQSDHALDRLDDGHALAGVSAAADALPFTMSTREHFAGAPDLVATGDARVDAATGRLVEVPDLPTADHVSVYEDVHHRLQDTLSEAEVR